MLNLPDPPGMRVHRDFSGGFGTAESRDRGGADKMLVFPVYIPYVLSSLKRKNYDVDFIDGQAPELDDKSTLRRVKKADPDIIISMVSLPSLYSDMSLLDKVKEELANTKIVAVGTSCNALGDEILSKSNIDYLIRGNYPFYSRQVTELVNSIEERGDIREVGGILYKKNRSVIETRLNGYEPDLDGIDFDVYRMLKIKKYELYLNDRDGRDWNYFPVIHGVGCPFSCIYCPYPQGFGKKIIYKSTEKLMDEIRFLSSEYAIESFLFRDQIFTLNRKRVKKICDELMGLNLDIKWLFETRVDSITPRMIEEVARAGCNRIHYGVETGDPHLLKTVGKPGVSLQLIRDIFAHTRDNGIFTMAHAIIGLPGETKETLENTYRFISSLSPDAVSWNLATPYPGTELFNIAKEKDLILDFDWSRYTTENTVMRTEKLDACDLQNARDKMSRDFRIKKIRQTILESTHNRQSREFLFRRIAHHMKIIGHR